jgi:PTS system nitrogen regulatory IIA component
MPEDDFDIEGLAAYLHLDPAQVSKLADRGKLPGRKVGGVWRFSQAAIHHWLEEQIGLSDDEELAEVEGALQRSAQAAGEESAYPSIASLLPVEAIAIPLEAKTRNSVITSMVELAARTGRLWDPQKMADAVRSREEMHPTTLENGVALMHPRRPLPNILAEPCLALGLTQGRIPFGGGRGVLSDVFFLICSVDDRGHLRTLARLSRLIAAQGFLDTLRAAEDARSAHELIAAREVELFG